MTTTLLNNVVPILHPGDHLTFDEFIERAENSPHIKHAELINGIVYMTPAQRHHFHIRPLTVVFGLLTYYAFDTPGVEHGTQGTIKLDNRNAPEPDVFLRLLPVRRGNCDVNSNDYLSGPPELVIEIAASSVSHDLYEKKDMYQAAGVLEYLVWRTEDEQIDCFDLIENRYQPRRIDNGIWESKTFPGLRLDLHAILRFELQLARQTLQHGMTSDAYLQFHKAI